MKRVPTGHRHAHMQRGAGSVPVIVAIIIIVVLALAAWLMIIKPRQDARQASALPPTANVAVESSAAAPPVDVGALGVGELLQEASKAMNDRRIIAPAGNNAFEFYLGVLAKEPGNVVAQDALRETFPFAASAVEQDINANRFDDAQREIGLLAEADPGNYTLTILRSKLDAQRRVAERAEEQERLAAQQQQRAQAAAAQATVAVAPDEAPEPEPEPAAKPAPAAPTVATRPEPEPVSPEPAPTGPTRSAVLVQSSRPVYPTVAHRRRQQGWVDVEFTVDVDGNVKNAHVVASERGRVFNQAAIAAVEQWKFQPALQNGRPVKSVLVQRINFQL